MTILLIIPRGREKKARKQTLDFNTYSNTYDNTHMARVGVKPRRKGGRGGVCASGYSGAAMAVDGALQQVLL